MPQSLFEEFDQLTKSDWLEKVKTDLKGKLLEDLNWKLEDDIEVAPFYHPSDQAEFRSPLINQKNQNEWLVGSYFREILPFEVTNQTLLAELNGGIEAPLFTLTKPLTSEQLSILFQGVTLEFLHPSFSFPDSNPLYLTNFLEWISHKNPDPSIFRASFGYETKKQGELIPLFRLLNQNSRSLNQVKLFKIATDNSNQSASETLADLMVQVVHLIQVATEQGLSVEQVIKPIYFHLYVGEHFFVEISKIRALKVLWANILKTYNVPFTTCYIQAHLRQVNQDESDYSNMIRAAVQGLAAVVGGVDQLFIPSYNQNLPKDRQVFGKRIARNVQHLLKLESYANRVVDPAAGSYYVEALTEQLVKKAWSVFLEKTA